MIIIEFIENTLETLKKEKEFLIFFVYFFIVNLIINKLLSKVPLKWQEKHPILFESLSYGKGNAAFTILVSVIIIPLLFSLLMFIFMTLFNIDN